MFADNVDVMLLGQQHQGDEILLRNLGTGSRSERCDLTDTCNVMSAVPAGPHRQLPVKAIFLSLPALNVRTM